MFHGRAVFLLSSLFIATIAAAQSTESVHLRDAVGVKTYPAAPRIVQGAIEPALTLDTVRRALPEKVFELQQWNAAGNARHRNGVVRRFVDPVAMELTGASAAAKSAPAPFGRGVVATTSRGLAWGTSIRIKDAQRVRLHLRDVTLPDDAVLWVYGNTEPVAFGKELIDPSGALWTPSAWGDTIHIEVEVPAGTGASFAIDQALEILDDVTAASLHPAPDNNLTCLVDVNCVTSTPLALSDVERAIAFVEVVDGSSSYSCTAALINDKPSSGGNPAYLIASSLCVGSQAIASSLQAFWDWKFPSCSSSTAPSLSSVPSSNGSTLMVTSSADTGGTNVALLRLNSIPGNRLLLGWTADTSQTAVGTKLYRIAHDSPPGFPAQPQHYSSEIVTNSGITCSIESRFIYSFHDVGVEWNGSNGAPVMVPTTTPIVGQSWGYCAPSGHDPNNRCSDTSILSVDTSFASSYPILKPFIDSGITTGPCTASSTVVCLNNNRFKVSINWKTSGGQTGQGQAIKYTDSSALFWFFGSDNIEVLLKVLNACSLSNTYWVFSAATTDVEYTITVTDTANGKVKTYFHAGGSAAPAITDTSAFATCP